jgi:Complex I intermediate-associated protein 30 (CIA30)
MGGISLSSIKQMPGEDFARWSGICRIDGGGFCGTRTLPFEEPLQVGKDAQGLYLRCRFTSDNEPQRRVWKLTTRTEASRGEQLYQAMFEIPYDTDDNDATDTWQTIVVPFSSFAQVRGPRLVQDGVPLNITGGLYQIGMTMSKFQMGANTTELPDFRAGFFELQLSEVGVYSNISVSRSEGAAAGSESSSDVDLGIATPVKTLSKEEVEQKRPMLLKVLSPVFKVLFNEKRYVSNTMSV